MTGFPTGKIRGLVREAIGPYVIPSTEDAAVTAALSAFRALLIDPEVAKAILATMQVSLLTNPINIDELGAKYAKRPNSAFMVKAYGVTGAAISAVLTVAAEGTDE